MTRTQPHRKAKEDVNVTKPTGLTMEEYIEQSGLVSQDLRADIRGKAEGDPPGAGRPSGSAGNGRPPSPGGSYKNMPRTTNVSVTRVTMTSSTEVTLHSDPCISFKWQGAS